jgi:hypothetical protein
MSLQSLVELMAEMDKPIQRAIRNTSVDAPVSTFRIDCAQNSQAGRASFAR